MPDDTPADLRRRVRDLERRVAEQTGQGAVTPGRAVLAGGALVAMAAPSAAATTYVETDQIRNDAGTKHITVGTPVKVHKDLQLSSGDIDASKSDVLTLPHRTSDPSGTSPGDAWYRTDTKELRVQTDTNGIIAIPTFSTGSSGSSVYEMLRIETASGTRFIPAADTSKAKYPYIRLQTQNQGVLGLHNEAAFVQTIDSFEDGDISEYSTSLSGGSVSVVDEQNVTPSAPDGSKLLEIATDANTYAFSVNGGLNAYPSRGDDFRVWHWAEDKDSSSIFGFFKDSEANDNGYWVRFDMRNDEFKLVDRTDGTTLASTSFTFSSKTEYEAEIRTDNSDNIVCELFESGTSKKQISATDGTNTGDGISFVAATGDGTTANYYFDHARIL